MSPPWMPLYVGNYLADTRHLSTVEHGAYLLLIMHYWVKGGLPDDDKQLARIAGLADRDWRAVRQNIASFFGNGWQHKRIDAELERADNVSRTYASRARKAAEKRWHKDASSNAPSNASSMLEHAQSQSQSQKKEDANASSSARASPALVIDGKVLELRTSIATAFHQAGSPMVPDTSMAAVWIKRGYDPDIVLATIVGCLAKNQNINSLRYFEPAIVQAHAMPRAPERANARKTNGQSVQDAAYAQHEQVLARLRQPADDHAPRLLSAGGSG